MVGAAAADFLAASCISLGGAPTSTGVLSTWPVVGAAGAARGSVFSGLGGTTSVNRRIQRLAGGQRRSSGQCRETQRKDRCRAQQCKSC
jgi:hypothetical protein